MLLSLRYWLLLLLTGMICVGTVSSLRAATIKVPADQATIQAGIDAAVNGDTVLVASGPTYLPATYSGAGNRDLDFGGKAIVLKSSGGAALTRIDCGGSASGPHVAFTFHSGEGAGAILDGFTIRNAWPAIGAQPGAIHCGNSSPTIRNCIITANSTNGIHVETNAHPRIENCQVSANTLNGIEVGDVISYTSGGTIEGCLFWSNTHNGILVYNCDSLRIVNCTAVDNDRNGIQLFGDMPKVEGRATLSTAVENCITAFNGQRGIDKQPGFHDISSLICNDAFGNGSGDFAGVDTLMTGAYGNFSADPLFCSHSWQDFALKSSSPCAAINNFCLSLIGAYPVGCTVHCGDSDRNGVITISDVVGIILMIFTEWPPDVPVWAGDADCNRMVTISDAVYMISYIFVGGPAPCAGCP